MEDVPAVAGTSVPLEFSRSQKGHSKGATVATAVAVTSIVFGRPLRSGDLSVAKMRSF